MKRLSCRRALALAAVFFVTASAAVAVGPPSGSPDLELIGDGPWVVRAWFSDLSQVAALAAEMEPWEVHPDEGYLVVDIEPADLALLRDLGFGVELDEKRTARLHVPRPTREQQADGIPGFPCYRTVEETYATAQGLASSHPLLAQWVFAGPSWEYVSSGGAEGYLLHVLRLTRSGTPGPKPKLFAMGAIHAREYATAELLTRFAEMLVAGYDVDPDITWLLDHHEIHLMLQANPDGRKKAEAGALWRKNTNEAYCGGNNSRGADLNRNYSFEWGCCGGSSGNECSGTYRGASADSEPETDAVQDYVRSQFPDVRGPGIEDPAPTDTEGLFLDIHSYGQLVLWPWGFTFDLPPNSAALQTLGRKLAWFNGYSPSQAPFLYITDGTTDDFAYGELGLPAYTFEIGTQFFQSCAAFQSTVLPDNLASLLYSAKAARRPYLEPAGPDVLAPGAVPEIVAPGDSVTLSAIVDDTRFNNTNGSEPVQIITSARITLDVPPWQDPVGTPMDPSDGAFDETVEAVTATISTAGLSQGRHTAYIVGEDAAGNTGAPSAVFFWVLEPPVIEGYVSDAASGWPLTATVSADTFATTTAPDGSYSLAVPTGTYTVAASAPGFEAANVSGVEASDGEIARVDFELEPLCALWQDDVESGDAGWTADAPWAITAASAASGQYSWTDSPDSDYQADLDIALTSPAIDLTGGTDAVLRFAHRYELEAEFDFGYVELSLDGGVTWLPLAEITGTQAAWTEAELPLPGADGQPDVRVRFRLVTDSSGVADGWYVDDVAFVTWGPACRPPTAMFADDFESGVLTDWAAALPPGDLQVASRGYSGELGLEMVIEDQLPVYVQDDSPSAERDFHVRFYHRNTELEMADGDEHVLYAAYECAAGVPEVPGDAHLRVLLRRAGGATQVAVAARLDDGGVQQTVQRNLAPGWRAIEVHWKASDPGQGNGTIEWWIDGLPRPGLSGLANELAGIDCVRWGAVEGIDPGTASPGNRQDLDDYDSRRDGYIGLVSVFGDVPPTSPYWRFIHAIYGSEVTAGCGGGDFCPDAAVSRGQMAVFVLAALEGPGYVPPACLTSPFADVPAGSPFCPFIQELADRGIVAGCGAGDYCPDAPVTRAQMAVFLLATLEGSGYAPPPCTVAPFADVPVESGFCPWIQELADRGITVGCGGGNYCPAQPNTREQMAVFLAATFGLPVPTANP